MEQGTRQADVLILTAIRLEFEAVLKVEAGAVPDSVWEEVQGPSGLPLAFRSFVVENGRPLRVAVAIAPDMGATAAVNTLLPLVEEFDPCCIAMSGVCAGRRGKVHLGDVIAADRLYYYDTGKQLRDEVQQDLTTYKLRDDWKAALESMDALAHFRCEPWFQARPLTTEWREYRALAALRNKVPEPWKAVDSTLTQREWQEIVAALRNRDLLAATGCELTIEGQRIADDLLFQYMGVLPDLSATGTLHPFGLHIAPIGSGARVIEDERIWSFVSQTMRKTLGLEMEAAVIGELAHRQRHRRLDAIVMKAVMDFADHGRDDHFKEFAARVSAECLLWFLREHVSSELKAGFDDLLTPGTLGSPKGISTPSILLNARYAMVPWHEGGRSEILADLDMWADDPSRVVSMRLLHGGGGFGKTRLAIEWVRRRHQRNNVVGFLVSDPDSRWLDRLCGLGPPVIIVIDYAESRSDLVTVLQRVASFGALSGPRRRVRVLLLARSNADWWSVLLQQHPAIEALLEDRTPLRLPPLAMTMAEREAVFLEASMRFATIRQRPPVLSPPISLEDARFERVLYLHMAALSAVEASHENMISETGGLPPNRATFNAASLMDEILNHEERYWLRTEGDRSGAATDVPLARQLVAAATLRGGLATKSEARELCVRLEDRPRTREDDAVIALLHDIYGCVDETKYLPALEPDLLGEGIVLRVAIPPQGVGEPAGVGWIERVLVAGDDAPALMSAFAVLGRASTTNPAAVNPWIARLLEGEFSIRVVFALRAAKAVGQWTASSTLGDLIADALEQNDSMAIGHMLKEEEIPRETVSLRRIAVWLSRKRLEYAPSGSDNQTLAARATLLLEQGVRLGDLGDYEPALATTRIAVELYRTISVPDSELFTSHLANGLNVLGSRLSALGHREEAFRTTNEAVDLYRFLATRDPGAFQPELAKALGNLVRSLGELGRREPALAAAQEAVDLYRILVRRHPDLFQAGLAKSLTNLGGTLRAIGRREEALVAVSDAIALYRPLVVRHADAVLPDLGDCLGVLGIIMGELGQREQALAVSLEAVDLYRSLAGRYPDAFQPGLGHSLTALVVTMSMLGRRELAVTVNREAVDLYRSLAERFPDAFQPKLAMSLSNLGLM
ncbi:MAG TPA: tetratricopeptide repeat protein, partial [Kofleriaceae bacterium]|nr:tetratricopeptide repeat protein [Kofleriaceae bacterium]